MTHIPDDDFNEDEFFTPRPQGMDFPEMRFPPENQSPGRQELPFEPPPPMPNRVARPVRRDHIQTMTSNIEDASLEESVEMEQAWVDERNRRMAAQQANPFENPLSKYSRVPGNHLELPTRGKFFNPMDYSPTMSGEIPVYPMRAQDELLMKNPDALMSGFAIEELIKSCVPDIKNPREISSPDLDAILLAIRAASYGPAMEIEVECPQCGHEQAFDVHLPTLMSNMTYVDPVNEVKAGELTIVVKPYTLKTATFIALATFKEARLMQELESTETDENALNEARNAAMKRLSALNNRAVTNSVLYIKTPETTVTEPRFIGEFIQNAPLKTRRLIDNKLAEINSRGVDKNVAVSCTKCEHEWTTPIEFNPSTFFDQRS